VPRGRSDGKSGDDNDKSISVNDSNAATSPRGRSQPRSPQAQASKQLRSPLSPRSGKLAASSLSNLALGRLGTGAPPKWSDVKAVQASSPGAPAQAQAKARSGGKPQARSPQGRSRERSRAREQTPPEQEPQSSKSGRTGRSPASPASPSNAALGRAGAEPPPKWREVRESLVSRPRGVWSPLASRLRPPGHIGRQTVRRSASPPRKDSPALRKDSSPPAEYPQQQPRRQEVQWRSPEQLEQAHALVQPLEPERRELEQDSPWVGSGYTIPQQWLQPPQQLGPAPGLTLPALRPPPLAVHEPSPFVHEWRTAAQRAAPVVAPPQYNQFGHAAWLPPAQRAMPGFMLQPLPPARTQHESSFSVLEAYELSRQEEARWHEAKQRRLLDQISRLDEQEQRIRAEIKDLDGNLNRIRVASSALIPGPKLQLSEIGASIYCAL
jgi:hypothetical protein